MKIYLTNSLTKTIEELIPVKENQVSIYSCGPTVYNYAHIGNMRAFLFADLLQRVLRVVGKYEIKWVMNITNIDDKTIRDSAIGSQAWIQDMGTQTNESKENLTNLTIYYENAFKEDIKKLGINLSHFFAMPRATDYINEMQELIKMIHKNGFAYVSDGSVYFNVNEWRKQNKYGRLFYIDFENFRAGVRIDADQYEREDISDFVLWKSKKSGEPFWNFDIDGFNCDGRPGWHIECSAMEFKLLGLPFDIHTGGIDLKFPHHEDEIAQSHAGYGIDPTKVWCHNEFLEVEGEKMSKSLGNFFTIRDLINKNIDPIDVRFAMQSVHYGSKYNFTFDGIKAAHKARFRIQDYIYQLFDNNSTNNMDIDIDDFRNSVFSELANDLHTPKALAKIFSFINSHDANELSISTKQSLISFFKELNDIFEAWILTEKSEQAISIPKEIIELAENRIQAKKDKNWKLADSLRNDIINAGFIIKDTKDSYTIEINQ